MLQRVPDRSLGLGGAELRSIGEAEPGSADRHGLKQRVASPGDGGQVEHRIALEQAVVADVLAVRPFRLDQPPLVDVAFEHQLGIGGHLDVDGHAFDHRHRRAARGADHLELVHRRGRGHGGEKIIGMAADGECDRQALTLRHRRLVEGAQIAQGVEIDAGGAEPAQHQPAAADIGEAGFGVAREIDAGRNVGRAIEAWLQVHGKQRQVGVVPGQHHLLHRSLRGGHPDRRQRMSQPLAQRSRESRPRRYRARQRAGAGYPSRCRRARAPWPDRRNHTALGLQSSTDATSTRSIGSS